MHPVILPDAVVALLAAFEPCRGGPSYRNFRVLVAGWLHGFGRRTITAWPWRPRERGNCVPAPQTLAATWRRWRLLPVTLDGQAVTPQIFALTALW
jgi:hypothetical protein